MIQMQVTTSLTEALLAFPFIRDLDQYYPDVANWYVNTALPGIITGDDLLLLAKEDAKVVGVVLAKRGAEMKLRCVRVAKDYQHQGLGPKMIDKVLPYLGDKPVVTVAEELLHGYSRMFVKRYGFELSDVTKGLYRPQKLEYHFN